MKKNCFQVKTGNCQVLQNSSVQNSKMHLMLRIYFPIFAILILFYYGNAEMMESCRPSDVHKPPRGSIPVDSKEYLKCNKMRPVVSPKIREKLRDFYLNDRTLVEIQRRFLIDVNKGLARNTHEQAVVKSFVTYVQDLPTGNEEGKCLALDLSGTYLRF